MKRRFLLLFLILIFQSCFKRIDEHLLIDRYHFKGNRADVLDLYSNHTYSHRYHNNRGQVFECHGKWRYNGVNIDFHDFCFFNETGFDAGSGIWISEVDEEDGEIHLIYSEDDGGLYFANN